METASNILREIDTHIVMVTRHARPGVLRRALASGVKSFVPKSTPSEKLAEVILAVVSGARYVDPEIAASALIGTDCPLTGRELDVLRATTEHDTLAQTAEALHLAPGTVRNYVSAAIAKLGVSGRHEAAQKAWKEGWI